MGPCEHGNKYSGSKRDVEFLDHLSDYQHLSKSSFRGIYLLLFYWNVYQEVRTDVLLQYH